ncbi:MAG: phosphoribosylglycinamide formyltransferase [Candidatus Zixiibacteriota bacterium]|nr:MAG: phosphoribosylglycinamide formyltransferase [candidate division Zixibacteria bacterium]
MMNLAAFASGRGTNFTAILHHLTQHSLPARYVLLVSDRANPPVAEVALSAGIPFLHLNPKGFASAEEYAARLVRDLERYRVDWITLAGYLKMVPAAVVQGWHDRILNIHPALLPFFGGPGMYGERVHRAVIESGMKVSGATVHLVDEQYDHGPIILQDTVPVRYDDTPDSLAHRVLEVEHRIYPQAVELAVMGKIRVDGRRVEILP